MRPIWERIDCAECGERFVDEDDWLFRHSRNEDGEDVHDYCCPNCKEEES